MKLFTTIAILLGAVMTVFVTNQITAEEPKSTYNFAEATTVSAIFKYSTGETEAIPFEVFEQERGFDLTDDSLFKLEKVVGHTPLLHNLADESMKVTRSGEKFNSVFVDVDVLISRDGKVIRQLDYNRCLITDYKITTKHDEDQGWHATDGFSLVDEFEFTCDGYQPSSPPYQEMKQAEKGHNIGSKDLKDTSTWPQNMRPN